jgi:hypothetical protein
MLQPPTLALSPASLLQYTTFNHHTTSRAIYIVSMLSDNTVVLAAIAALLIIGVVTIIKMHDLSSRALEDKTYDGGRFPRGTRHIILSVNNMLTLSRS